MENGLTIYKSSAGSGKTFTLVREYLKIVLRQPEEYRHILAITFTNKAAEEMKNRVIEALVEIGNDAGKDMQRELEKSLKGIHLPERAKLVLKLILHDYPSFAVSTIDSFFQRLLRSLAREIHLPLRAEVQLQEEDAINEVTDQLLHEAGNDKELSGWLEQLILKKMEEDKGWNLEKDIAWIAKEMLKERGSKTQALSRDDIHRLLGLLSEKKKAFEQAMRDISRRAADTFHNSGFEPTDFSQGSKGAGAYLMRIARVKEPAAYEMNSYVVKARASMDGWIAKKDSKNEAKKSFAQEQLSPLLEEAGKLMDTDFRAYMSAIQLLRTLYLFGIINDLTRIFSAYRKENNQILISDTPKLLQEIISGDDTPFIYEKTGNKYKYLLIDEFQDTSEVQWKNLLPLVINSLGSGFSALIVGDAKQSIYRWRGGELQLLLKGVRKHLHTFEKSITEDKLDTNFRSKKEIVEFNNQLFSAIPTQLETLEELKDLSLLRLAYGNDLTQLIAPKNNSGGYVEVRYINNEEGESDVDNEEDENTSGKLTAWKKKALQHTLTTVNDLLQRGFRYRDIAILVRSNLEGNTIANFLFENGIHKIISPDSLAISGAPVIRFILNLLRVIADPKDDIARGHVVYYYLKNCKGEVPHIHRAFFKEKERSSYKKQRSENILLDTSLLLENYFNKKMPAEFLDSMGSMARMPVYEVSELLVRIFELNKTPDAYVQRLQDLILEYNAKHHASISGFLSWWDDNKNVREKSVVIPENENAIRIMTIHKSKGLQFPVVIMPFMSWKIFPKPGELIWVSSDEKPFDELGKIGIYSGTVLSKTVFSDDWNQELSHAVIDNVNLLYVAFTRPEVELYLFAPQDDMKEMKQTHKLLHRTLLRMGHSPDSEHITRIGNKTEDYIPKKVSAASTTLPSYPVNRWQEKISITTKAATLSSLLKEKKDDKIKYGIMVHSILAEIRDRNDIDAAMEKIVFEGIETTDNKSALKKLVTDVIEHPHISRFFTGDWEIRREQEILTPEHQVLRPDRVLTKKDHAIIIDFKTGKPASSHPVQLRQYGEKLEVMGYKKIEKYLVYLNELSIEEVN